MDGSAYCHDGSLRLKIYNRPEIPGPDPGKGESWFLFLRERRNEKRRGFTLFCVFLPPVCPESGHNGGGI
jgi:hypothetical protein